MRPLLHSFLVSSFLACFLAGCTDPSGGGGGATCGGGKCDDLTPTCQASGDCPGGAKFCLPDEAGGGVCLAGVDTGYGACGDIANLLGVGAPCQAGTCAGPVADRCAVAPRLDASFCTMGCASHAECGDD